LFRFLELEDYLSVVLGVKVDLDRSLPNPFFHIRRGSREDTHNRGYNYQVFGFVIFVPGERNDYIN
jgi:hypothetical protein